MVAGDIVYLKYFQKSQRALRLNRQASASSVEESRGQNILHILCFITSDKI